MSFLLGAILLFISTVLVFYLEDALAWFKTRCFRKR
jgi:hypothetical protein